MPPFSVGTAYAEEAKPEASSKETRLHAGYDPVEYGTKRLRRNYLGKETRWRKAGRRCVIGYVDLGRVAISQTTLLNTSFRTSTMGRAPFS